MMSAAAISARIRAKKKQMEDGRDLVKLSGIPEDATDLMVIKNKEPGEMLSENMPKERDEEPSLEAEMASEKNQDAPELEAPYSDEPYGEDGIQIRKDRIRKMMSRMRG